MGLGRFTVAKLFFGRILCAAVLLFGGALVSGAHEAYSVAIERGVESKMKDGTVLRADLYRPNAPGPFPVLLERTPYNKVNSADFALKAAARGYLVVLQDVRGRYSSDGEWYPFRNESSDGYDTVEWAASLSGSNGQVGMIGGSYVGATQLLTAIVHPPHLAGLCPVVTASNYHDGWTYQGGAFEQWFDESWTSGLAQDTLRRLVERNTNALDGVWKLPLSAYPVFQLPEPSTGSSLTRFLAPYFQDWLSHPEDDQYWKQWSIEEHYSDIQVPMLTIAAWYDIFLGGSLRNYEGVKLHGGNEAARQRQRLLVVIGGHAGSGRKIGSVDFGPAAKLDEDEVVLKWYDYLFKNQPNEFSTGKRIKLFVMGANQWREEEDWPLPRARTVNYYLHSDGRANTAKGNGSLSSTPPEAERADSFRYDPTNPVPTVGGPLCCDSVHLKPGPLDQSPVEAREDVLVYSTPPLAEDLEVTGPVSVELFASSSAEDTDFTAKLVDLWPDGFAENLTEGILRARYRNSQTAPEFLRAGQVYRFTIDLWATSNVFQKGHRLRLEISSSNFPRFDRNFNTREKDPAGGKPIVAVNSVRHESSYPSSLTLQWVPAQ
jgi:uncharacterized protein